METDTIETEKDMDMEDSGFNDFSDFTSEHSQFERDDFDWVDFSENFPSKNLPGLSVDCCYGSPSSTVEPGPSDLCVISDTPPKGEVCISLPESVRIMIESDVRNAVSVLKRESKNLRVLSREDIFSNPNLAVELEPSDASSKPIYVALKSNKKLQPLRQLCGYLNDIREKCRRSGRSGLPRNDDDTPPVDGSICEEKKNFRHKQKCRNVPEKCLREDMLQFFYNEICCMVQDELRHKNVPEHYAVIMCTLHVDDHHAINRIIHTLSGVYDHLVTKRRCTNIPTETEDELDTSSEPSGISFVEPFLSEECTLPVIVERLRQQVDNLQIDFQEHVEKEPNEAHRQYTRKLSRGHISSPSTSGTGHDSSDSISCDEVLSILVQSARSMTWKEVRDTWIASRGSSFGVDMAGMCYNRVLNDLVKRGCVIKTCSITQSSNLPLYRLP